MKGHQPNRFRVGERFKLMRELGSGGMGVVFEAHDRERDVRVALKTLLNLNPASLYRFKREFRALADVTHPNLVSLYELIEDKGQWFFTMELVDGVSFLTYVRGLDASRVPAGDDPTTATGSDLAAPTTAPAGVDTELTQPTLTTSPSTPSSPSSTIFPPAPPDRLLQTLPQLTAALLALHTSGHLHRDIKPSNVMVTNTGRVVVLDFGVITELSADLHRKSVDSFAGTPRYVAPEQLSEHRESVPASDWYSVGVMLFEAITGHRLFNGSAAQVLAAKQHRDPVPPSTLFAAVDPLLEEVCVGLLERDPDQRLTGTQLATMLSHADQPTALVASPISADELIGRKAELEQLTAAFEATRAGKGRSLIISGTSGIGKTALVQQFLAEVSTRTAPWFSPVAATSASRSPTRPSTAWSIPSVSSSSTCPASRPTPSCPSMCARWRRHSPCSIASKPSPRRHAGRPRQSPIPRSYAAAPSPPCVSSLPAWPSNAR